MSSELEMLRVGESRLVQSGKTIMFWTACFGRSDGDDRVDVRYLRLQKPFDCLGHRQLDQKVEAFGVDAKVNNLAAQCQKGRSFRVRVKRRPTGGGLRIPLAIWVHLVIK